MNSTTVQFPQYFLPVQPGNLRLSRAWLWLGMMALIGSGILAILLVISRTPGLQKHFPLVDFFHVALVVHVDLSVLVWFVSVAGLLWTLSAGNRAMKLGWGALGFCAAGTGLITLSPFVGHGHPVMANYIPVLEDPIFLAGLLIFGSGSLLLVVRSLFNLPKLRIPEDGAHAIRLALAISLLPASVALIAFCWSWITTPSELLDKAYYEILFWGGGHALQFIWTIFMLVAWLWLACACGAQVPIRPPLVLGMFVLASICVWIIPVAYLLYPVHAVEHRQMLTFAMSLGGGLPILPIALATIVALPPGRPIPDEARPLRAALYASLVLFTVGGVIGFTIAGSNVKIPAHYHGAIVGVTLSLMGVVYYLLPHLQYGHPPRKLACFSSYCYATGQLMHIGGLVWSGGYGVQRKVAGAAQVLRTTQEVVAMGIMGLGGLIAIIGGLLFVVAVMMAIRRGRTISN